MIKVYERVTLSNDSLHPPPPPPPPPTPHYSSNNVDG